MKSIFLDALNLKNQSRPPVWLMRQAGRYMPEYRALRQKYSFLEMVHTPEIAVETTLLPLKKLGVDAAILFSDILVIPEAMGLGLRFEENAGPIIERPIQTSNDIDALPKPCMQDKLGFVGETIKLLKKELHVPLIGFCGAPFTLASYIIEGKSSTHLRKTKKWLLSDPQGFHRLLEYITELTVSYIQLQIDQGIQAFQIFDSWAHVLGHSFFLEFSLKYMKKLLQPLKASKIPAIVFCRGSSLFASELASISPNAISLDWHGNIQAIRRTIPSDIALQGNLDPEILLAPKEVVQREVRDLLRVMEKNPSYIFNLGHGVLPDTPFENVKALVDVIKSFG